MPMEFYVVGGVGMGLGFALRAFVIKPASPQRRGLGRRRLEAAVIVVAVSFWIFSPLAFPAAADALEALGVAPPTAVGGAWWLCFALVGVLGFTLGWVLGPDKAPRPQLPNPYRDGDANPFGNSLPQPGGEGVHPPDAVPGDPPRRDD
jgi:hypothetical protein